MPLCVLGDPAVTSPHMADVGVMGNELKKFRVITGAVLVVLPAIPASARLYGPGEEPAPDPWNGTVMLVAWLLLLTICAGAALLIIGRLKRRRKD